MTRTFAALALLSLALAACGADDVTLHGYAEGRFRMLAPESAGRIATLTVHDGDHVAAGAVIAHLDDARERAELARAEAGAEAAAARFDDAAAGGREPEIEAARELLAQARAAEQDAHDELARVRPLHAQGVVARARLNTAEAGARAAEARVAEMRERVTLVELPARENMLKAFNAEARAAAAAVEIARDALSDRTLLAPSAGRIERVLREEGETGSPNAALAASPSVWRGDELVAAPLAGMANGWSAELIGGSEEFFASLLSH